MLVGQTFRTTEKRKIRMFERVGNDGLNEGDLVAHLVELAQGIILVEQQEGGGGERRLRNGVLQLLAQKGGGSCDSDLVHEFPFFLEG